MDEQDRRDRIRRPSLHFAAVLVGLGVASTLTGWHREAAVPLLLIGILYAASALVLGRRRRR